MIEPAVLFEDNHCLAVSKPAGLLTQGVPDKQPTLESWAREYLKTKYDKKGRVYLGIPHRLDRPVSGVVLFARSTKSAQRLAEQFRERQTEKIYWAAVEGETPVEGVWEDWLLKIPDVARSSIVVEGTPSARQARTEFRRLTTWTRGTILELKPTTGRMHQLRIQAASRGFPIVGDSAYGSQAAFGPQVAIERDRIIALHARSLTFLHPIRFEPMTVVAPLPVEWNSICTMPGDLRPDTMIENQGESR